MKKVIFYQAKPVGVHDLLNYFWDGQQFNEGVETLIDADKFHDQLIAACRVMDDRFDNGQSFLSSSDLIVEDRA